LTPAAPSIWCPPQLGRFGPSCGRNCLLYVTEK
jgi:hypothetical protein